MSQVDNNSPYTITGVIGQVITLTQPGQGGYPGQSPLPWCILQNTSGLTLSWQCKSNGGSIPPFGADVVTWAGYNGPVQIICTMTGNHQTSAGELSVTWSDDGDPIPGGYPVAAAITSSQPQSLLASVGANVSSVIVSLPANTESLLINSLGGTAFVNPPSVIGVTTGQDYPVYKIGGGFLNWQIALVSDAQDSQMNITWPAGGVPDGEWYVIADAGVRGVIDLTLQGLTGVNNSATPSTGSGLLVAGLYPSGGGVDYAEILQTDQNGRLIPLVPDLSTSTTASGVLLAAPTSGAWALFGVDYNALAAGGGAAQLYISGSDIAYLGFNNEGGGGPSADHTNLDGYRVTSNVSVWFAGAAPGRLVMRYAAVP